MVEENTKCIFKQNNKLVTKLLCAAVIFASGIIIGGGAAIMLVKYRLIWVDKAPHMDANVITNKIAVKYALTPEQIEGVREIMNRAFAHKKANDEWMDKQRDDYAQVIITEMNSVLTPEQYTRWYKDFLEMREKFKKRK